MSDTPWYAKYQVPELPTGESGNVKVSRFTVHEEMAKANKLACMFSFAPGMHVPAGNYTRITEGNIIWMSDTPMEIKRHNELFNVIRRFREDESCRVLIHGLGLGVAVKGCFHHGATQVTVVEKNPDVLKLAGEFWKEQYGDRLILIEDDALTWKPVKGAWWDVVWHDIWKTICEDNRSEISKLHRRFGRRSGWQQSWARGDLDAMKRRERSNTRYVFW